jgi:hypothetical protein
MAVAVAAIMPHDLTPLRIPLSESCGIRHSGARSSREPGIQQRALLWIPGLRRRGRIPE